VLFVPALVFLGVHPAEAAPLGLLTVAAGSLSASAPQLESALANHRLGISLELTASIGAVIGALASGYATATTLSIVLAIASGAAGAAILIDRSGDDAPDQDPDLTLGGRTGSLTAAYADGPVNVFYEPVRLRLGAAAVGIAGLVAGLTGTSGGFVKTPVMNQIMRVPVKAAAATTVFMVGVTAASALTVLAVQGRIDPVAAGSVVVGGLAGGRSGAWLQSRLPAAAVRRFLGLLLLAIAILLVVRS